MSSSDSSYDHWSPFRCLWSTSDIIFEHFSLALHIIPSSFCIFLALDPESAISPRNFGKCYLKSISWALKCACQYQCHCSQVFSAHKLNTYLCQALCFCVKSHEFILLFSSPAQKQSSFLPSPFPLFLFMIARNLTLSTVYFLMSLLSLRVYIISEFHIHM